MKRTEFERKERELGRVRKKIEVLERKQQSRREGQKEDYSIGDAITELSPKIFHDGTQVYNTEKDDNLVEFFMEIKETFDESDLDNILRKSLRKTGIKDKVQGFERLKSILTHC